MPLPSEPSIVQTRRQLNSKRRDTNFFSARHISGALNKANSCIEFRCRSTKPLNPRHPPRKEAGSYLQIYSCWKRSILSYHESVFTQRIYIWLSNIFVPLSRLETGVPGVSRLGLCMAGVELLPLFDWKTSAGLGPVYCTFASLGSTRLLGTIGGQAAHIWAAYNLVSSWILLTPSSQQEGPGAYRQSYSLIERDRLRSISCTGPPHSEGKHRRFLQGLNLMQRLWCHFKWWKITHILQFKEVIKPTLWGELERFCWSVTSWIILLPWKANLLAKIITFGSMPWSGQLCNFTNSSWWKVDLKGCNYTHLSYTSQSRPLMLKKVKLPECKLKKTQHNCHEKL